MLLDLLGAGMTIDDILADYADLAFAARLAQTRRLSPVLGG